MYLFLKSDKFNYDIYYYTYIIISYYNIKSCYTNTILLA